MNFKTANSIELSAVGIDATILDGETKFLHLQLADGRMVQISGYHLNAAIEVREEAAPAPVALAAE